MGIDLSYLMNREQRFGEADLISIDPSLSSNFSDNNALSYAIPNEIGGVDRFDLGVNLEYRYQFNQKWSANFSYHHGNLFQQNEWRINNRFFRLGSQFSF